MKIRKKFNLKLTIENLYEADLIGISERRLNRLVLNAKRIQLTDAKIHYTYFRTHNKGKRITIKDFYKPIKILIERYNEILHIKK